jgi:hypothetical protein
MAIEPVTAMRTEARLTSRLPTPHHPRRWRTLPYPLVSGHRSTLDAMELLPLAVASGWARKIPGPAQLLTRS